MEVVVFIKVLLHKWFDNYAGVRDVFSTVPNGSIFIAHPKLSDQVYWLNFKTLCHARTLSISL